MDYRKIINELNEEGYIDERGLVCHSHANYTTSKQRFIFTTTKSHVQRGLPSLMLISLCGDNFIISKAKTMGGFKEHFSTHSLHNVYPIESKVDGHMCVYKFSIDLENNSEYIFSLNCTKAENKQAKLLVDAIKEWKEQNKSYEINKDTEDFKNDEYYDDVDFEDGESGASTPGRVTISNNKWKKISKDFNLSFSEKLKLNLSKKDVADYICNGDSQPAMVVSLEPLLIAAFSEDFDAVVILKFPNEYVLEYNLELYSRLIIINTYNEFDINGLAKDIYVGDKYKDSHEELYWADVNPIIACFITDDQDILDNHSQQIPEETWGYVKQLGCEYLDKHPNQYRDGHWFVKRKI